MKTIYILWLRQLKRFKRSPARMVGSLGQPLMFLFGMGFGFSGVFEQAGQGNYIQFLAPGLIAVSIIFTAIFSGMEILWDRQFGFLKETLVAPVSRTSIMIGRALGGATVAIIQGIIVLLISLMAGFRPESIPLLSVAFVFMFLIAMLFAALGSCFGSLLKDFQGFPLIMNFIVMPAFFLSGALFPLDQAPAVMQWIANFNPLSYGVDGLRGAFNLDSHFGMDMDFAVLVVITALLLGIGSWLFKRMEA